MPILSSTVGRGGKESGAATAWAAACCWVYGTAITTVSDCELLPQRLIAVSFT